MMLRSPVDMVILWGDQGLMIYETYPHPRGRPPAPMLDQMPGFAAVLTGPAHPDRGQSRLSWPLGARGISRAREPRVLRQPRSGLCDEAIRISDRHQNIFAVLTDIKIPRSMDGIRLAQYVRDRHPPTVLLVASGVVRPEPRDLPSGAQSFAKAFNPQVLLEQLSKT